MHVRRAARPAVLAAAVLTLSGGALAQDAPAPDANGFLPVTADPPYDLESTGRYGGTLTWATIGELDTFNPIVSGTATNSEIRPLLMDTLVGYDNAEWRHTPSLAWRWETTPDNLTWTFRLRKGVRWSDGAPFTSKDVLFSFAVVFDPRIPNPAVDGFKIGDNPLPALTAPDDWTVVFTCSVVDALFLVNVGNVPIVPEHVWGGTLKGDKPTFGSKMSCDDPRAVIGTGPFRVVQYNAAESVVFERNPWSWRTTKGGQRLPFVDRIVILLVKDLSTRTNQFLNGDFDILDDFPAADYARVKEKEKAGGFRLHRLGLSLNTNWICFNQHPGGKDGRPFVDPWKLKWFQDVRFRRAMSHAVDRDSLVKLFFDGRGEAIYGETTRANKTWYADHAKFEYDPAKAKALLDAMGLKDRDGDGVREDAEGHPVAFDLTTNVENDIRVKIIAQLKADFAAVGVAAELRPVNFNELVAQLEDGHRFDCMLLGWGSGVPPDPLNGKNILLSSGRQHVWYPAQAEPADAWEAENDRLIDAMSSEVDEAKRVPMWHQVLERMADRQPIIYLFAQNAYATSKSRVKNVKASILRPSVTWAVEELWLDDGK